MAGSLTGWHTQHSSSEMVAKRNVLALEHSLDAKTLYSQFLFARNSASASEYIKLRIITQHDDKNQDLCLCFAGRYGGRPGRGRDQQIACTF
jgi:hypothetical protein